MLFAIGLLVGLVVGTGLLVISSNAAAASSVSASRAGWPAWTSLGMGIAASGAFAIAVAGIVDSALAILPVIALQFAAVVFAVGRLVRGDRRWQSWLGSGLAVIPVLFWIVFVVAEIVGPEH